MADRITIIDVSKEAGVSVGTASQALNQKKGVATATIEKVRTAAEKLNYFPSITARTLRSNKSNIISLQIIIPVDGYIHPSSWNFYFRIIRGFSDKLKEHNYRMHLEFNSLEELNDQLQIESVIKGYHVQALAFIIQTKSDYSSLLKLRKMSIPMITIHAKVFESISSIKIDNFAASKRTTEWLNRLGHKRIAFINGPIDHFVSEERKQGYLSAIQNADFINVYDGDWTIESGYRGFNHFVSQEQIPTAIFCANDHMAIGALKAAQELNIRIPEMISIVGFDDDTMCQLAHPNLTSIHQPLFEIGQESAEMLISRIQKSKEGPKHIILPTELVIRSSAISLSEVELKK